MSPGLVGLVGLGEHGLCAEVRRGGVAALEPGLAVGLDAAHGEIALLAVAQGGGERGGRRAHSTPRGEP